MFVWGLSFGIFHSYGDVIIAGEGLQILTMAIEHLGFFSVPHLYCDTGLPFIMVISEDTPTLTPIAERLAVELSLPALTT